MRVRVPKTQRVNREAIARHSSQYQRTSGSLPAAGNMSVKPIDVNHGRIRTACLSHWASHAACSADEPPAKLYEHKASACLLHHPAVPDSDHVLITTSVSPSSRSTTSANWTNSKVFYKELQKAG